MTKGVAKGRLRGIHQVHRLPKSPDGVEDTVNELGFDGYQKNFQLAVRGGPNDLVIPDNFFNRERNVVLGVQLNNFGNFFGLNRRKLTEFGKDLIARGTEVDFFRRKCRVGKQSRQSFFESPLANSILGSRQAERLLGKCFEGQSSSIIGLEGGNLDAASP